MLRLFHSEEWPLGTIASQLGIHHTTVQRVLGHSGVAPKVAAPRPSLSDSFEPFLIEQLEKHPRLRASRRFEMVKERGYTGGPDHFQRIVARHRPRKAAEAFQRLRTFWRLRVPTATESGVRICRRRRSNRRCRAQPRLTQGRRPSQAPRGRSPLRAARKPH